jgi:hypothetical protein
VEYNKKKETGKLCIIEQMPTFVINNEKMKDPEKVAVVFNSFFPLLAGNFSQHQAVKGGPISFLQDSFPSILPWY